MHPCRIPHGDSAVEEIVSGSGEFIRNESLSGAIMMLPWLRHLPFVRDKFLASKRAPLKMRKMQVTYWAGQKNLVKGCRETLDCYCVSCEYIVCFHSRCLMICKHGLFTANC